MYVCVAMLPVALLLIIVLKKPSGAPPGAKSLNSILNLDMVAELTGQEIGHIWNEFHSKKVAQYARQASVHLGSQDGISASIPSDKYKELMSNAKVLVCECRVVIG